MKLTKEYKELEAITSAADQYKKALATGEESQSILDSEEDAELKEMAQLELEELSEKLPEMEQHIKLLLVPARPGRFQKCNSGNPGRDRGR